MEFDKPHGTSDYMVIRFCITCRCKETKISANKRIYHRIDAKHFLDYVINIDCTPHDILGINYCYVPTKTIDGSSRAAWSKWDAWRIFQRTRVLYHDYFRLSIPKNTPPTSISEIGQTCWKNHRMTDFENSIFRAMKSNKKRFFAYAIYHARLHDTVAAVTTKVSIYTTPSMESSNCFTEYSGLDIASMFFLFNPPLNIYTRCKWQRYRSFQPVQAWPPQVAVPW